MARRKTNRYRINSSGLRIENSLDAEWCRGKTEKEIVREMLTLSRLYTTLEMYNNGSRQINLTVVRNHNI